MRKVIRMIKLKFFSQPQRKWRASGYQMPAPSKVKFRLLARNGLPNATWIETGTYYGDTALFLSTFAKRVWTIEPGHELALNATKRLHSRKNVTVVEGLSEDFLDKILSGEQGNVCFWLDGHFSSGVTFQGPVDTPIRMELGIIAKHLSRLGKAVIFVDDVRCFDPKISEYSQYPKRSWLVNWADTNNLDWSIEHDIFIAKKY